MEQIDANSDLLKKYVLKGTSFESVEAVKKKMSQLFKQLSETASCF